MTTRHGPIYEITCFAPEVVFVEHETWLANKARDARKLAGVADCQLFSIDDDDLGRKGRVLQFALADSKALDDFIDGFGADITAEAASFVDQQVDVSDRVLREDESHEIGADDTADCLNCGAHMRGQYCGHCGQRSRSRLISLWELISDAFGDLLEIDSRLWNTLVPLLRRPGLLTHDYLQGRRARYMPPFRMYLVLSLLFFLVAFFDPQEKLGLLFEPEAETSEVSVGDCAAIGADEDCTTGGGAIDDGEGDTNEIKQEILDELAAEGIIVGSDDLPDDIGDKDSAIHISFDDDDEFDDCNDIEQSDIDDMPAWIARRLTIQRLRHMCEKIQGSEGQGALLNNLLDNVPAALIVLLPLMALVLKVLYPLSRRYYVEHLLFFVHFHAFFFLILTLQVLFARLMALSGAPEPIAVLVLVAMSLYIPVYLFVSMRRVYGQNRAITFFKYIILVIAYASGFLATMMAALAIAAFAI
jgi:hypothetical protein